MPYVGWLVNNRIVSMDSCINMGVTGFAYATWRGKAPLSTLNSLAGWNIVWDIHVFYLFTYFVFENKCLPEQRGQVQLSTKA